MSTDDYTERIERLAKRAPENRHSYFQLKYFVIGKEPTLQAQMWQCLREIQSRRDTIESLSLEIEQTRDNMELARLDLDELPQRERPGPRYNIELRCLERKSKSLRMTLEKLQGQREFAMQEARFFVQAFESLEKMEPMRDYDDLSAQQEYWNELISRKINLKSILRQPLDAELIQTALCMDETSPIRQEISALIDELMRGRLEDIEKHRAKMPAKNLDNKDATDKETSQHR